MQMTIQRNGGGARNCARTIRAFFVFGAPDHPIFVSPTAIVILCLALAGCATEPASTPSLRQQAEADLVVEFQSWNAISFIKPDITGTAGMLSFRRKTFTKEAVVKLLHNLKVPRKFVVVVLDRQYSPDPIGPAGGMDEIQRFFQDLGFRRVALQDGAAWNRVSGMPILKDTAAKQP